MGLLERLKDSALQARKAAMEQRDEGVHATFLTLVFSEAQALAKIEQRLVEDKDVEAAIIASKKQLKTLLDGNPAKNIEPLPAGEYREQTQARYDLLLEFVPAPLEGETLGFAIREAAAAAHVDIEMKSMGVIMAKLKEQYGAGQIDGAQVRELLSKGV